MSLCEECEMFDLRRFDSNPHRQQGYAYDDVVERSFECAFCALLQSCFEPDSDAGWIHLELLGRKREKMGSSSEGLTYIRVFLGEKYYLNTGPSFPAVSQEFPLGQETLLRVFADRDSPASGDSRFAIRPIDRDDRYDGLNDWLAECVQHEGCQITSTAGRSDETGDHASPLPTRCLNVGTNEAPVLFLEETLLSKGRYLTLSHRWTDMTSACSTTTSNYLAHLISLEAGSLPKIFQEAIGITRYLEVKYLWIDSLCIVQQGDKGLDWRIEAKKMTDYYQKSFLTLSAINPNRLLPLDPPLSTKYIVKLPFRRQDQPEGCFFVFKLDALNEIFQREVQDSELLTRAWVFQEYLLSRRIVHFTPYMTIFDCQTNGSVSQLSDTIQEVGRDGRRQFFINKQFFKSTKRLSVIDRTVALAGAAAAFRRILESPKTRGTTASTSSGVSEDEIQYIEGIWIDDAYLGLMWEKANTGNSAYLASHPSWSWTSLYSEVLWNSILYPAVSAYASLEALRIDLINGAPPEMHLRSKVQPVAVDRILKAWEIEHLFERRIRPRVINDHYRALRITNKDHRLCGWASIDYDDDQGFVAHDRTLIVDDGYEQSRASPPQEPMVVPFESADIQALHISTPKGLDRAINLGYWLSRAEAYFVLLIRNRYANVYERIGMGCLFGKEVDHGFKSSVLREIIST